MAATEKTAPDSETLASAPEQLGNAKNPNLLCKVAGDILVDSIVSLFFIAFELD